MIEESLYRNFLIEKCDFDSSHDLNHIERVVNSAKVISRAEGGDPDIIIASAWLHDCVILPKNSPDRPKASTLAADKARSFLQTTSFPKSKIDKVEHAIKSHSYSGDIAPQTIEAKIVQDADRLDALGAIGIARCFMVGGRLDRPLYEPEDPFCESREPDDSLYTLDHFYQKLFRLPDLMNTDCAKKMARNRVDFMKSYLNQLRTEI
ncbi:HD domain-containing protein [Rhodohalobacter halophilus]|uniref:HD domain-containing protein n=1 Tax=Rhodohalobacter halophilus TaxID=1812810 RepID=UPI00083F6294|nr:HD domain-containing protein [Rhodohalobacter halophilus]